MAALISGLNVFLLAQTFGARLAFDHRDLAPRISPFGYLAVCTFAYAL